MNPKERQKIDAKITERHAAEADAKAAQGKLDKLANKCEQRLMSFPYLENDERRGGLAVHFGNVKRHDYYRGDSRNWPGLLEPLYDAWKAQQKVTREAWQKLAAIDAEMEPLCQAVWHEFADAYNARIEAMHQFLVSTYEPLCTEPREVETLLQFTPRYQRLLLDRKYGDQGKTPAGRISSMFAALSKLETSKAADLAAMKTP